MGPNITPIMTLDTAYSFSMQFTMSSKPLRLTAIPSINFTISLDLSPNLFLIRFMAYAFELRNTDIWPKWSRVPHIHWVLFTKTIQWGKTWKQSENTNQTVKFILTTYYSNPSLHCNEVYLKLLKFQTRDHFKYLTACYCRNYFSLCNLLTHVVAIRLVINYRWCL